MPTDRMRARVERLLNEADVAVDGGDWELVRGRALTILRLDPGNEDASQLLEAANRRPAIPNAAESGDRERGERRQLTVMFCDLVDSTPMAEKLDPEDKRRTCLWLSAAGQRVYEKIGTSGKKREAQLFSAVGRGDQEHLSRTLDTLVATLLAADTKPT